MNSDQAVARKGQEDKLCISFQMHLDSPEALGVLNTLFETVAPSSLRPVDMLLKSMFTTPVTMVRALIDLDVH